MGLPQSQIKKNLLDMKNCASKLGVLVLTGSLTLMGSLELPPAFAKPPMKISQQARQQIKALLAEKASRTPIQQKISAHLLHAHKMRKGQDIAPGISSLRTGVKIKADGTTEVDIRAEISESILAQIEASGGTIINQVARYGAIRATIPIEELENVANLPDVNFIRPAEQMMTNSHDSGAVNVSEGDVAHQADLARATFGVDGTGITIGVLSDGVDTLAARQASGDLPANVTVLSGQAGSGDEGTAMLEIVHDLAPGADLIFATAIGGTAAFATNIEALRTAGADIIVDDVFYFEEPAFQDGIIAQAVNTVTADGALYFSSAGNSGNLNDGTSGVWEGDFLATDGPPVLGAGVIAHDFDGGVNSNQITKHSPFGYILWWSDPFGGSGNDYDLFLLSSDLNTVIASSTNLQIGAQYPVESIVSGFNDLNRRLVIVQNPGASDRFFHLNTLRRELSFGTHGQITGHAAAMDAFAVAAVDVATAGGGAYIGGPTNPVEIFSSDGSRQIYYNPDGTAITPGDVSSTGGIIRQKPDLSAADGVATSTPGFNPFFGTSAAAPHAAAIAGLIMHANPSLTPTDIRNVLTTTALEIEGPGFDPDSGYGIVNAFAAVNASIPPTFPLTVTLTGNGSGTVLSTPLGSDCPGDCTQNYVPGTTVTLTATPSFDSTFIGWTGACTGSGNCLVTMDQTHNVSAMFTLLPQESLAVTLVGSGGGSIVSTPVGIDCPTICTQGFLAGSQVTLTAAPDQNSTFDGWSEAGCAGTNPCTILKGGFIE